MTERAGTIEAVANPWMDNWPRAVLIVLLTLLVYVPAITGGYVWNDDSLITGNPALHTAAGLKQIWFEPGALPRYNPLVQTGIWLEHHLWGPDPYGYHLVNVLLHAFGAVLLWILLRRLSVPGAWFAAMVFALHPINVESVAWITQRKNVLSGLFYFASILTYLRWAGIGKAVGSAQAAVTRRDPPATPAIPLIYAASLAFFVCALLSAPVTISLPAALLLLLWWKRGRVGKRDLVSLLPFFVVGIAAFIFSSAMNLGRAGGDASAWPLTAMQRLLLAGRALWFYTGKIFWPREHCFIYPRWDIDPAVWWQYLFPVAAATVLILAWAWRRRLGRGPLTALLFFAGTLLPAIGHTAIQPLHHSWVADHLQYLAGIGLVVLACGGAASLLTAAGPGARRTGGVAGVILLIALGTLSWRQGHAYADRETLWRDTLAKNQDAWVAHNNLAGLLLRSGRYAESIEHYSEALRLRPDDPDAHANLGQALTGTGDLDAAAAEYRRAIDANPGSADLHVRLAELEDERANLEQVAAHYREALRIEPDNAQRHTRLGVALAGLGRTEEAIVEYRQALDLDPTLADAHNNLGAALADMGQTTEAVSRYLEALRLDPESADARVNLGNVRVGQGRLDEAAALYRDALGINPQLADAHNNLGFVTALQGRLEEAVEYYQRALRLRPDFVSALNNMGNALAALGFLEPAAAGFSRAVELQPESADIRYNLAMALARLGRQEAAAEQFREVLRINPGDGQARAMLRRLEQGPPFGTDQ
jgi:tetratricopeptide (TPR) repeat protein